MDISSVGNVREIFLKRYTGTLYDFIERPCQHSGGLMRPKSRMWALEANTDAYFPVVFGDFGATRDEVFAALAENNIGARKYFYPITNSFECYANYSTAGAEKTPVAAYLADHVLTLPMYADLTLEDVDRICEIILSFRK